MVGFWKENKESILKYGLPITLIYAWISFGKSAGSGTPFLIGTFLGSAIPVFGIVILVHWLKWRKKNNEKRKKS